MQAVIADPAIPPAVSEAACQASVVAVRGQHPVVQRDGHQQHKYEWNEKGFIGKDSDGAERFSARSMRLDGRQLHQKPSGSVGRLSHKTNQLGRSVHFQNGDAYQALREGIRAISRSQHRQRSRHRAENAQRLPDRQHLPLPQAKIPSNAAEQQESQRLC